MQWFVRTSLTAFHRVVELLARQQGGFNSQRVLVSGKTLHIYWTACWHAATLTIRWLELMLC